MTESNYLSPALVGDENWAQLDLLEAGLGIVYLDEVGSANSGDNPWAPTE